MSIQRVAPAVLAPLQDALTAIYWYKPDLRTFLDAAVGDRTLVARLDFSQVKRQVVRQLVSTMAADQHKYYGNLVNLILAVADVDDPTWLKRVDGGEEKYREARESVETLRLYTAPYRSSRTEAEEMRRQREVARELAESRRALTEGLAELNVVFSSLKDMPPQQRGYALEKLIPRLFRLFDVDARESFRIHGEQIDGAFTLAGAEYLFEAKWQQALTPLADLYVFVGKVRGKLDNTLGLFLSINGFEPNAIDKFNQQDRSLAILMDGGDLALVLDGRMTLPELLTRKRQHAARTGETFVSGWHLMG